MNSMFSLDGRVAVVTGASSGLGARFVEVLAGAGARVVAAARRGDRLEALAAKVARVVPVVCDVAEHVDRERLLDTAWSIGGRLDVLVNNAGVSGPSTSSDAYPLARWDRTLEVNLTATFALASAAGPRLFDSGGGAIVNVSSCLALIAGTPMNDVAYAASKGGVISLTRQLGVEWAPRGVRVNAIVPGWFETEMTEGMASDERSMAYVERGCPMRRMGAPKELDGALLFLASDASSYCTGQTLVVDGGWTAR